MLKYFPLTGRLIMTDDPAAAQVILDTDDDMLCVKPADVEVGSLVVPARTAYSSGADGTQTPVDEQQDYYIATLDVPGANVVRGMMRVTWASNPEPADNLWRQASGTHLDILDGVSQTMVPQSDTAGYNRVASLGGYTFFVNDLGHLVMRERIVMRARDPGGPPATYNRARQQATVAFRLLVGFFLNANFTLKAGLERIFGSTRLVYPTLSLTVTGVKLGYAFTGRRIVFVIPSVADSGAAGATLTRLTVDGVAATIHGSAVGTGANEAAVTIASILKPTGTTATVVLTYAGGNPLRAVVLVYALRSVTGAAPVITKTVASAASAPSVAMTVGDDAIGIVCAANSTAIPAFSSNVTVDETGFDGYDPTKYAVGRVASGSGPVTVTASHSPAADVAMIAAVFK